MATSGPLHSFTTFQRSFRYVISMRVPHEQIWSSNFHSCRNPARFPVLHTLHAAVFRKAQKVRNFGRASKRNDQRPVGMFIGFHGGN